MDCGPVRRPATQAASSYLKTAPDIRLVCPEATAAAELLDRCFTVLRQGRLCPDA